MLRRLLSIFCLLLILAWSGSARANLGENIGFGSRSAGLAGIAATEAAEAYSAYGNPAALAPATEGKRLRFSLGLTYLNPDFFGIDNVVLENNYVSDKATPRYGGVDTDVRSTLGQTVGVTYTLPGEKKISVGAAAFVPLAQLAYLDSGEAFAPEYVLHRSRTQRPQIETAVSFEPWSGVSLGVGAHLAYSLTTNASVFLQSDSSKPSSLRLGASLKPVLSPNLGIHIQKSPTFSLGSVLRFPARSAATVNLYSAVRLTSFLPALDVNFLGTGALFYDPLSVESATAWEYAPGLRLLFQLDYQAWSRFESPALRVEQPTVANCQGGPCGSGFTVSPSQNPSYTFRDIWVPRIGHEWKNGSWTWRGGYFYRPTILSGLSTGAGNYLDPSRHAFTFGAGVEFDSLMGLPAPWRLDFHGSYQALVGETIVKTAGNEVGNLSDVKIGSPGYVAGGKIWGGGVSLSLAL